MAGLALSPSSYRAESHTALLRNNSSSDSSVCVAMRYRKVCLENTWKHPKFPTVQPFLSPFAEGGSMTPGFLGWISWRTDHGSPLMLFSKWGHSSDWCRKITSSSHYVWNWTFFAQKERNQNKFSICWGLQEPIRVLCFMSRHLVRHTADCTAVEVLWQLIQSDKEDPDVPWINRSVVEH